MSKLASKLAIFQFAEGGKVFLCTNYNGEIGWARGPTTPDGMPREPVITFYPNQDLSDEDLEQPLADDFASVADKKERWWHELPASVQDYLLSNEVQWSNGKPTASWSGPRPQCCQIRGLMEKSIGDSPKPFVALYHRYWSDIEEERNELPKWHCGNMPIVFCPLCGTKLPEVEKDPNPTGAIHSSKDGNYCDSCNQRNRACDCRPPWAAYRLKNTKKESS